MSGSGYMYQMDDYMIVPPTGPSDPTKPIKAWVTGGVLFEDHAREQLLNVARLPFIFKHVAAMPDVHAGQGATIGTVVACQGAVSPAIVGVDLGCGVAVTRLTLTRSHLPTDLTRLFKAIDKAVPSGRTDNGGLNDRGAWGEIPTTVQIAWMGLEGGFKRIHAKHPEIIGRNREAFLKQLGTLGTGNHFIELSLDEEDRVWIVLHSGSRGVGNKIGTTFIDLAKKKMRQYFISMRDMSLAYLPEGTEEFDDYLEAAQWAQEYAKVNRELMTRHILRALKDECPKFEEVESIDCHHNFVARECHFRHNVLVIRKGAIRAREGDRMIIPGSMGARSYIGRGLGHPESFMSCSHGAGRAMSRTDAKACFTLEDHRKATEGIVCPKGRDVLDETPGAYKDIDLVMAAQKQLVTVEHTLRQIVNIKGIETDNDSRRKKKHSKPQTDKEAIAESLAGTENP